MEQFIEEIIEKNEDLFTIEEKEIINNNKSIINKLYNIIRKDIVNYLLK